MAIFIKYTGKFKAFAGGDGEFSGPIIRGSELIYSIQSESVANEERALLRSNRKKAKNG